MKNNVYVNNKVNTINNNVNSNEELQNETPSASNLLMISNSKTEMSDSTSNCAAETTNNETCYENSLTVTNNTNSKHRVRNESIKNFTQRFRSFSIDLMRSIELAHDMVDLRNSNFATATQSVAAQQYNCNEHSYDPEYGANDESHLNVSAFHHRSRKDNRQITEGLDELNIDKLASQPLSNEKQMVIPVLHVENESIKNVDGSNEAISHTPSVKSLIVKSILNLSNIKQDERKTQINAKNVSKLKNADQVDMTVKKSGSKLIPDDIHISILEVFIYLWGVITFFADFITDIILSIEYFNSSKVWLGFMTLLLVIVPNVTLSLFSLSWYIDKYKSSKTSKIFRKFNKMK
jgi:hypothetical protein